MRKVLLPHFIDKEIEAWTSYVSCSKPPDYLPKELEFDFKSVGLQTHPFWILLLLKSGATKQLNLQVASL